MDLRKLFFENIEKLAEADDKIILIVGDLGFSFYEKFAEKYPKQFLNGGCIEQSLIGIAAGMAKGGLKPYVYSNAIFLLSRAHEFVRDDVAYNNANVKLIGTGAAGFLGFSHNIGTEESEKNWLMGMPNLKQHYPQSEAKLKEILMAKNNCPEFIRL